MAIPVFASAQGRRYTVGTTVELIGGRTNNFNGIGLNSTTQQGQSFFFFYGAYPSITVISNGARSAVNASYAFGWNQTETATKLHSNSHSASFKYSISPSQRWRVSLSEGFQMTDDASTFNGFRGVTPAVEDFRFVFNPVAARLTTRSNSAGLTVDNTITDKSGVSFNLSHSVLDYGNSQVLSGSLSNQQRVSGGMTYNRRTSVRDTWSVGYTASYFDFAAFDNSFSHQAHVGYSTQFGRDLTLQLTVGASQSHDLKSRQTYIGYNTSASLQKRIEANSFSLYYTQTSGDSSGLGSISDTRSAGFSLRHDNRSATLFADISAFDTRGRLSNTLTSRGLQGTASIGVPITRTLAIQVGGQYQQYDHTSLYAFAQKRVFLSLRYNNPNLIRK